MPKIRTRGLRELVRALKKGGDADKASEIRDLFFRMAVNVKAGAEARATSKIEALAAASLLPSKTQDRARITLKRARGFEMGAEFGAYRNQPRKGNWKGKPYEYEGLNQFKPWRGTGDNAGYFLFPTIREKLPAIENEVADELKRILES